MRKLLVLLTILSLCSQVGFAQSRQITGTVVNESDGNPAVGVMVVVSGTQTVAITDANGRFSISADPDATLSFSSLGLEPQEVALNGRNDIRVAMANSVQSLEEVVVVGFGTQKKVNLTGSIASVGAEVFENRPVTSIGQALQGVMPNVNISIENGAPNTAPSFNIRGGTTMQQDANDSYKWKVYSNEPLILVDGIQYSSSQLNQLNPNDIQSLTAIKDASAAAIYGTRATYGVILVTTKSGRFGQEGQISYSYDFSLDSPSAIPDILDAASIQQASINRKMWTDGSNSDADNVRLEAIKKWMSNPIPENAWYSTGANSMDWVANMNPYDLMVKNTAATQKHNLSIRGGSESVSYYISLGYQNQDGMYKIGYENHDRYNALVRLNAKVKKWFNVEARANYSRTEYVEPYITGGKGKIWSAMMNEPFKNINQPLMTGPNDPTPNTWTDNIISWAAYGATQKTQSSQTTLSINPELIFTPYLKAKGEFAWMPMTDVYNRVSPEHRYITGTWTPVSEQADTQEHKGTLRRNSTENYTINTYLDFNKTWGKHNVSAVLGFNQESVTYGQLEGNLRLLFSPTIQNPNASEDPTMHTLGVSAQRRTGRGAFGRIGYIFNNRYLFEANGRYDGSSRFPKYNRYQFYPSFSGGWIISEESFMESLRGWLDHLKIRGSWGQLGSQPDSYYPYQLTLPSGKQDHFMNGTQITYVGTPGLVDPSLDWQKTTSVNLGLDAVLLHDRLTVGFDWFRRIVTDILLQGTVPYPSVLGANAPMVNAGKMRSLGWELEVKWRDHLENGISYSVGVSLSDQRTQVMEFPENENMLLNVLYKGMYTGDIWGYTSGGIVQEEDLVSTGQNRWAFYGPYVNGTTYYPGANIWYKDLNGDGVINDGNNRLGDSGDKRLLGNNTPRYRYGITANVAWKGLDLNIFFQGVGKRDLWIDNSRFWGNGAGSRQRYENSWTPERTNAKYPMYGSGTPSIQTAYMTNGAYLRLKQLVLGYTLPSRLTDKAGISRLRFTVSAYNLFTITKIPNVFDVDMISDAYPQKKTVSFGAQITF